MEERILADFEVVAEAEAEAASSTPEKQEFEILAPKVDDQPVEPMKDLKSNQVEVSREEFDILVSNVEDQLANADRNQVNPRQDNFEILAPKCSELPKQKVDNESCSDKSATDSKQSSQDDFERLKASPESFGPSSSPSPEHVSNIFVDYKEGGYFVKESSRLFLAETDPETSLETDLGSDHEVVSDPEPEVIQKPEKQVIQKPEEQVIQKTEVQLIQKPEVQLILDPDTLPGERRSDHELEAKSSSDESLDFEKIDPSFEKILTSKSLIDETGLTGKSVTDAKGSIVKSATGLTSKYLTDETVLPRENVTDKTGLTGKPATEDNGSIDESVSEETGLTSGNVTDKTGLTGKSVTALPGKSITDDKGSIGDSVTEETGLTSENITDKTGLTSKPFRDEKGFIGDSVSVETVLTRENVTDKTGLTGKSGNNEKGSTRLPETDVTGSTGKPDLYKGTRTDDQTGLSGQGEAFEAGVDVCDTDPGDEVLLRRRVLDGAPELAKPDPDFQSRKSDSDEEDYPVSFEVIPPKHSEVHIQVGSNLDAEVSKPMMSVELVPGDRNLRSSFHNLIIIPINDD